MAYARGQLEGHARQVTTKGFLVTLQGNSFTVRCTPAFAYITDACLNATAPPRPRTRRTQRQGSPC